MNRIAVAVVAWVLLGLEAGLMNAMELGHTGIAPSFVTVLAVFVALAATPGQTVWTCLLLGLCLDLTNPMTLHTPEGATVTIVGPFALGFVLMGQFLLTMRSMLIRHNPLTMAAMVLVGSIIVHVFVSAAFTVRSVYDPLAWELWPELTRRLGVSAYSAVIAFPMALALIPAAPLLGLHMGHSKQHGR